MSETNDTPPVICTITEDQQAARPDRIHSILTTTYTGVEEHDNGFTFHFEGTTDPLPALGTFVTNELSCCSFATYSIETTPPYNETRLQITGPNGTKAVFRDFIQHLNTSPQDTRE